MNPLKPQRLHYSLWQLGAHAWLHYEPAPLHETTAARGAAAAAAVGGAAAASSEEPGTFGSGTLGLGVFGGLDGFRASLG